MGRWLILLKTLNRRKNENENKLTEFILDIEFSPHSREDTLNTTNYKAYKFIRESCRLVLEFESEATVHRCSSKWVFLKIWKYSQENDCVGASF